MSVFKNTFSRAFAIPFYSDSVNIPFPNPIVTGSNTTVVADRLIDTNSPFAGVQIGDTVFNNVTQNSAYVIGIINPGILILSSDIFNVIGDSYTIYQGVNGGCYIYVPTVAGGKVEVETIGGDIVTFRNPPAGVLPVQVIKVTTGTDITDLIALW